MRITVINPNTTASMTRSIGESARAVAAPGTTVAAVTARMGPAAIESHYDEALSVPGLLAEIARAQDADPAADGFVVACFGDPGLDTARELARGPVVGITEGSSPRRRRSPTSGSCPVSPSRRRVIVERALRRAMTA